MIIDISQPVTPGISGFPMDTVYTEDFVARIGPQCPVNVGRFTTSTHCGTHADAPLHYDVQGAPIGALPLEPFIGLCRVIDARGPEPLLGPETVLPHLRNAPPRILLRLVEAADPNRWHAEFRALAAGTVELLARYGVVLVGIDTPSVDPETSRELPSHHAARKADMRILENLVLSHVEPGNYELIALPLKLNSLDASPVRAVLRRV